VWLRGFRKSHQLIPTSLDPNKVLAGIAVGSGASDKRAGLLRAYQPSYLNFKR
jgi:hypothetical protein